MTNFLGAPVITDVENDSVIAPELNGALRVTTVEIDGQTFVYASGFIDHGIQILQVDSDGQLTPIGSVRRTPQVPIVNPDQLDVVEVDGNYFLIVASSGNGAVFSFQITASGPDAGQLELVEKQEDGSLDHALIGPEHVETFDTDQGSFVAVTARDSNAVLIYQVSDTGSLTIVDSAGTSDGAGDLTLHSINDRTFLYVSGPDGDGLAAFEVAADGTLSLITELAAGSIVDEPLETVTINGVDLLVTANDAGLFTVYTLDANGLPTFLSDYDAFANDTFEDLRQFEIVNIEGATFLLSAISDGVAVYSLTEDGDITLVSHVVSAADLRFTSGLEYQEIDGRHFVIVSAFNSDAVVTLELGGDDDTIFGSPDGDILLGLSGDDTLSAADGNDTVLGGSGDDLLLPGFGSDTVDGGDGNDTVDYSNTWAVNVRLVAGRVTADLFRDTLVSIENVNGSDLNDVITGDALSNILNGNDGDDRLSGLAADDILFGGLGDDTLIGGQGNDMLEGGDDDDRLQGQLGDDTLLGDAGQDQLFGGLGRDVLNGGTEDDRLTGGGQADVFVFETGSGFDRILDWEDGADKMDLTEFEMVSFNAVRQIAVEVGAGLQLQFDSGDILQINGMTLADLTFNDVIL